MTVENIQSGYGNATVGYARKNISTEDKFRELFTDKLSQVDEVIRNGSTEKAIQLGGAAYTSDEWDEMIANFDATMDDLREQMRAEHAKRLKEQMEIEALNQTSDVIKAGDEGRGGNLLISSDAELEKLDSLADKSYLVGSGIRTRVFE